MLLVQISFVGLLKSRHQSGQVPPSPPSTHLLIKVGWRTRVGLVKLIICEADKLGNMFYGSIFKH